MEWTERIIFRRDKARKDYPDWGIKEGDTFYTWKSPDQYEMMHTLVKPRTWEFPYSQLTSKSLWLKNDFEFDVENFEDCYRDYLDILQDMLDEVNESIKKTPPQVVKKSPVGDRMLLKKEALEEWIRDVKEVGVIGKEGKELVDAIIKIKLCEQVL